MIVVDTNLLSYFYIPGEHSQEAEAVLKADPEWTAPRLWRSEFRNVLVTHLRRRVILRQDALRMLHESELLMQDKEYEVSSSHVLDLSIKSICSAYDCEFVALAQELGVSLLTMDKQILSAFPETAVSPREFLRLRER
ncbi:MAG: type II toxin-antitoxin system VapC family toxin [Candidatus Omnitrophica bacterium]|nr:type II toxin-antitoxin system VapC family toxin [Candidatus Omnitrophota bacterium]